MSLNARRVDLVFWIAVSWILVWAAFESDLTPVKALFVVVAYGALTANIGRLIQAEGKED